MSVRAFQIEFLQSSMDNIHPLVL
uniref:Uncharacterized protein n=1 Tax=Rhizophora mucronata TaxID=61149 RepID=A0A2P2R283_RHIMU